MQITNINLYGRPQRFITDWYDLSCVLSIPVNHLSYALLHRKDMQRRIEIRSDSRVVYESVGCLRNIQSRIGAMLAPFVDELPDQEVILAYRTGISATKKLSEYVGAKKLIAFDVKKYFDNVRMPHIVRTLMMLGFSEAGAKLIGRYCIVEREENIHSLQQGSPASSVISNLVGYYYIDEPILKWLRTEFPNLDYKYVRYCDNVELFLYGEEPEGFSEKYSVITAKILEESNFRGHDWHFIEHDDPRRCIEFLGVVLNKRARIDNEAYDDLRATLFNVCLHGASKEVNRYFRRMGMRYSGGTENRVTRMLSCLGGHASYVASVSEKDGLCLRKLIALAKELPKTEPIQYSEDYKNAVLKYKDKRQSVKGFVNTALEALGAI